MEKKSGIYQKEEDEACPTFRDAYVTFDLAGGKFSPSLKCMFQRSQQSYAETRHTSDMTSFTGLRPFLMAKCYGSAPAFTDHGTLTSSNFVGAKIGVFKEAAVNVRRVVLSLVSSSNGTYTSHLPSRSAKAQAVNTNQATHA